MKEQEQIRRLQRIFQVKRLYKQMQSNEGNPDQRSIINLTKLWAQLAADSEKLLSSEENIARDENILTAREEQLRSAMHQLALRLKHATQYFSDIAKTNELTSLQQRARISHEIIDGHTGGFHTHKDNVYFSLGSPEHQCAEFVGSNPTIIQVDLPAFDLNKKRSDQPHLEGLWFGPHNHGNGNSIYFGNTLRAWIQESEDTRTIKYIYVDSNSRTRQVKHADEMMRGTYLREFLALKFILELRFIGNPYRDFVLNHITQVNVLEAAVDHLFTYPFFEVKIPVKLTLKESPLQITIVDPLPAMKVDKTQLAQMRKAVIAGDLDKIQTLLEQGINIDCRLDDPKKSSKLSEKEKETPLIVAIKAQQWTSVDFLLMAGADARLASGFISPLHAALRTDNKALIEILFNWTWKKYSPFLIQPCIDLNFQPAVVFLLLMPSPHIVEFCKKGDLNLFKKALLHGLIPQEEDTANALAALIQTQQIDFFSYLLPFKKQLDQIVGKHFFRIHEKSLLMLAAEENQITFLSLLFRAGAKLDLSYTGFYSSQAAYTSFSKTLGQTALMRAAACGSKEAVAFLYQHGANINHQDFYGRTALDLVENNPRQENMQHYLKSLGAEHGSSERLHLLNCRYVYYRAFALIRGINAQGKLCFLIGRQRNVESLNEFEKTHHPYVLPGGKRQDEDNTFLDTALRGTQEETYLPLAQLIKNGLATAELFFRYDESTTPVFCKDGSSFQPTFNFNHYFEEIYLCDVKNPDKLFIHPNGDFDECLWITEEQLNDYPMKPSRKLLIQAALKNQLPSENFLWRHTLAQAMDDEYDGGNLLFNAIQKNNLHKLRHLLARGIHPDASCYTGVSALMAAAYFQHYQAMKILLAHHADINFCDHTGPSRWDTELQFMRGSSALSIAVEKNDKIAMAYLLQHGANPQLKRYWDWKTPLQQIEDKNDPELLAWFQEEIRTAALNKVNARRVLPTTISRLQRKIFLTMAPLDNYFEDTATGDHDYTQRIAELYQAQNFVVHFIKHLRDEVAIFNYIKNETHDTEQAVLHLIVNIPGIGTLIKLESLKRFIVRGGKVVVTAVEFDKYSPNEKKHMLNYLMLAHHIIFLDEFDAQAAVAFLDKFDTQAATAMTQQARLHLPPHHIIPVPPTVPKTTTPINERAGNIMVFGIIRLGKGFAHILKLANLIKHSDNENIRDKKIFIVGSVGKVQDARRDGELCKLMQAVYPSYSDAMQAKKPSELAELLLVIKKDAMVSPALPIEIHVNVAREELPALFNQCRYAYLPAYRGATLRHTSISSSLRQFVTYAHEGKITPACLKKNGEYENALVLIPYNKQREFYYYSAETVLTDIIKREQTPALNEITLQAANNLYEEELSDLPLSATLLEIYQTVIRMPVNPQIQIKWNFFEGKNIRFETGNADEHIEPQPSSHRCLIQ